MLLVMGKVMTGIGNTAGAVPRWVWSALIAGLDAVQTVGNLGSDFGTIIVNTKKQVWDVLSSPYAKGPMKWYNRVWGALVSPFVGTGVLVEGAVRSVLEPAWNGMRNVRDLVGNFAINLGQSVKWLFRHDKPISDFKFEHLATKTPSRKNWFSRLAWWKTGTPAPASASASAPASASASAPASASASAPASASASASASAPAPAPASAPAPAP